MAYIHSYTYRYIYCTYINIYTYVYIPLLIMIRPRPSTACLEVLQQPAAPGLAVLGVEGVFRQLQRPQGGPLHGAAREHEKAIGSRHVSILGLFICIYICIYVHSSTTV